MTNEFSVSVIIPVFNAEKYLKTAVESAVSLDKVGEVLLIEDNSSDQSYELCQCLEAAHEKVILFVHPNGVNRGVGASRNLGIIKSTCEYIAFLDADDWYLPNRFERAKQILQNDSSVDGVYEATGYFYQESHVLDASRLTTLKSDVRSSDLLYALLQTHGGRFHTNAITLRRSILEESGLFDESLRLHEDTHLWLRLAFVGNLVPGRLKEAVAIRRVHDENSIQWANIHSRGRLYERCFEWFRGREGVDPRAYRIIFNRYIASRSGGPLSRGMKSFYFFLRRPSELMKLI